MYALFGVRYCPFSDEKRINAFLEDDILLSKVQLGAVISRVQTRGLMTCSVECLIPFSGRPVLPVLAMHL